MALDDAVAWMRTECGGIPTVTTSTASSARKVITSEVIGLNSGIRLESR